jgi:hypothetical protein
MPRYLFWGQAQDCVVIWVRVRRACDWAGASCQGSDGRPTLETAPRPTMALAWILGTSTGTRNSIRAARAVPVAGKAGNRWPSQERMLDGRHSHFRTRCEPAARARPFSPLAAPACGAMGGFNGDGCLRGGDAAAAGAPARRSVGRTRRAGASCRP